MLTLVVDALESGRGRVLVVDVEVLDLGLILLGAILEAAPRNFKKQVVGGDVSVVTLQLRGALQVLFKICVLLMMCRSTWQVLRFPNDEVSKSNDLNDANSSKRGPVVQWRSEGRVPWATGVWCNSEQDKLLSVLYTCYCWDWQRMALFVWPFPKRLRISRSILWFKDCLLPLLGHNKKVLASNLALGPKGASAIQG